MEKEKESKKLTIKKAKNELIGAGLLALGLTGGSMAMKFASSKVPSPWLLGVIGLGAGLGIRVMVDNENVKDFGSGVMAAGAADLLKKGLNALAAKVPALQPFSDNIPTLSGPGGYQMIASSLRGDYADAEVVDTKLVSSLR